MMEDKTLSDTAKFVDSIDPMKPENLLRHAGFVDNGDGTVKINRPVPFSVPTKVQLRTCEHCKHWRVKYEDDPPDLSKDCQNPKVIGMIMADSIRGVFFTTAADFGCTLFEVKK